jgi:hypothetical protein
MKATARLPATEGASSHPAADLHGLSPDVCHDVLATIRHAQRWKTIATIATLAAALALVAAAIYFASMATLSAGLVCAIVLIAASHHVLALLYGHEADLGWTTLLKSLLSWIGLRQ